MNSCEQGNSYCFCWGRGWGYNQEGKNQMAKTLKISLISFVYPPSKERVITLIWNSPTGNKANLCWTFVIERNSWTVRRSRIARPLNCAWFCYYYFFFPFFVAFLSSSFGSLPSATANLLFNSKRTATSASTAAFSALSAFSFRTFSP